MCQKHRAKRKHMFDKRETKKFSLNSPDSTLLTNEIRAFLRNSHFHQTLVIRTESVAESVVAPVGADVLLKQQKQRSHQLGETPTDRRRHLAAFPSYTCLFVLCVCVCVRRCCAQGRRFVQLTAAAPFLLTSSQPCFKTVCVCAPSATTGGGGWLY
jgi:hypothetical protein